MDNFEYTAMLGGFAIIAELARCLDAAGALDERAKRTIHGQLQLLSKCIGEPDEMPERAALLDSWIARFPPIQGD